MVKFSCFSAQVHDHKSKKTVAPSSTEAMHKSLQDSSQNKFLKNSKSFNALFSKKADGNTQTNKSDMNVTPSSCIEHVRKSDEMLNKSNLETDLDGYLKKKLSVESELNREGNSSRNSADGANVQVGPFSEYQEDLSSESLHVSSDFINNESIFSVGDPQNLRKESHENSDISPGKSENHEPQNLPSIPKSCSVPVIRPHVPVQGKSSPLVCSAPRSRSSDDFHVLEMRRIENSIHKIKLEEIHELESDDIMCSKSDQDNDENENHVDEAYDSYNYVGSAKHWIMQDIPNEDFKNKRIEAWVIDLQHCSSLEETDVPCFANDEVKRDFNGLNNPTVSKLDAIVTPGMEAAKRYISSLNPSATTAQLVNYGLVVIPFFSVFASLKVLNLSGNSIVRITADALPRGLHMLNLSKNNISTIEGLRELTRLRILDLSYNRIVRIGHGLAYCSSIKELYLAGNKISEVEGFHRLLKLNILDLRFNKISTAKCLRQLAANYNSLQAISLEGNPAQKNVGDEQLKKYLQGLLTHLVYYNRQPIKNSTLQETALKSELKHTRKSGHAHGRKGQVGVVSTKPPRVRHGLLPPGGTKGTVNVRPSALGSEHRIMNLRQDLSMRRSRSEGTLGAL